MIELRKKLGITRTEFAARIGVSAAYIHILESGKQEITLRVLESISKSFDIPMSYFFEDFEIKGDDLINLLKVKIKGKINVNFNLLTGDFGEIYLEKKYVKPEVFIIKYEGIDIENFNIKKNDLLLTTNEKSFNHGDKLIVLINDKVKFCNLSIKRGNIILTPADIYDLSFIYEDRKMKLFKICKIIRKED